MVCKFCQFVGSKIKKHSNRFKFVLLASSRHTISFLSIDQPKKELGHILVVPKKHFACIEDLPKQVASDLMQQVQKASAVLRKTHEGCNVLINNGRTAGQYVPHVHVHVVPRDAHDQIQIELWKQARITESAYEKLSRKLRGEFRKC